MAYCANAKDLLEAKFVKFFKSPQAFVDLIMMTSYYSASLIITRSTEFG